MFFKFLEQQTERTEEEKSQLIDQLHNLVQQNQNVLTQALSNKDLFHEEARGYLYVFRKKAGITCQWMYLFVFVS